MSDDNIIISYTVDDAIDDGSLFEVAKSIELKGKRFPLGRIVCTVGVVVLPIGVLVACLHRHNSLDWGTVPKKDKAQNNKSVKDGSRILSSYPIDGDDPNDKSVQQVWVITEADRSVTTLLLPSEY